MTTYIVDQSVWSHLDRNPVVDAAMRHVARDHIIVTCPPQVLEYCHSARNPTEYGMRRAVMESYFALRRAPTTKDVLDVQQALWNSGLMRAAGAIDVLIASYAIVNDATVLSADRDFEAIVRATGGRLRHELVEVG